MTPPVRVEKVAPQPCEVCGRGHDIEWSPQRDKLLAAIVAMQGKLEAPKKGAFNDHRGYHYADLADVWEACRKPLADAQLAVLQVTEWGRHGLELVTTLVHVSGQWIRSRLPVLSVSDPQAMGSALTYARKYGLLTIVGLAPDGDDDDGQRAARRPPPQQRPQQQRQQQAQGRPAQRPPQGRSGAPPRKTQENPEPKSSAGEEGPVDISPWSDAIQAAGSRSDLDRVSKELAKAFPKGHPARPVLSSALRDRAVAIGVVEGQASQRDPSWTGD